ncbi:MAG: DUF1684 domain-containing protein [Chloroflexota bacterium]
MTEDTYVESIREWRQAYAQRLLSPDSWLAISGLFWLNPGDNQVGASPSCQVILPRGSGPALAGVFHLQGNEVTLEAAPGVNITLLDQPVTANTPVQIHNFGASDWILLNDLKLSVIQRGVRRGVRIYDKNNPSLTQFVSLRWYPIQPEYRIQARFVTLDQPEKLEIVNVIGDTLDIESPGYAEFSLQGETCRLMAIPEDDGGLWFIFHDATGKDATYAGGRYLTSEAPQDGSLVLDFNRAHNPPCAYTDFATCPLPPAINRLSVSIKAGEVRYTRPTSIGY